MKCFKQFIFRLRLFSLLLLLIGLNTSQAQDSTDISSILLEQERQRAIDSIVQAKLQEQLSAFKGTERQMNELKSQLNQTRIADSIRQAEQNAMVSKLKTQSVAHAVAPFGDTIFLLYTGMGSVKAAERAKRITEKLEQIIDDERFVADSLKLAQGPLQTIDIVYGDEIIMSITELDELWHAASKNTLAQGYIEIIKKAMLAAAEEHSILKYLIRAFSVILILAALVLLITLANSYYRKAMLSLADKKEVWFKSLTIKNYTVLTAEQELDAVQWLLNAFRWFFLALLLFFTIPLLFSIFPFTEGWAHQLFNWIWSPIKQILGAVLSYLPNLFTVIVIYLVMRWFIRLVRYIFNEIDQGKLEISGFHADWALPTFSIVRFLLYAFTVVLIFPYLPGSDSDIFKGVSVFVGVLFSLGSSSAISNMIAGLVITYMRPFKIGDRIQIGEVAGEVIEKSMLVTRVKTLKNEVVTIPNASVLSGNTVNYSSLAKAEGLAISTGVTIGYDVPWREVHSALEESAKRTDLILKKPSPVVLQTSLDDFYVAYKLVVYIQNEFSQVKALSALHQHIQDVFNERGIEILSPHYRAQRDGNATTIPSSYLPSDYTPPSFRVNTPGDK